MYFAAYLLYICFPHVFIVPTALTLGHVMIIWCDVPAIREALCLLQLGLISKHLLRLQMDTIKEANQNIHPPFHAIRNMQEEMRLWISTPKNKKYRRFQGLAIFWKVDET